MGDLIDREALKAKIYKDFDYCHNALEFLACVLIHIEAAPTIKPDVHGENKEDQSDG